MGNINTNPDLDKFFTNSKISFTDVILKQCICEPREALPWDCGLFLVSIFNIFVGIIETLVRVVIFLIVSICCSKSTKDDSLYNLIYTACSVYFSLKFVGMSLFNSKLDYNTLHINDPVQIFVAKKSYSLRERVTRLQ